MTTEKQFLYTLVFDAAPKPVVFYVGRTNDPKRREAEHRRGVADTTTTEYKYQFARQLEQCEVEWDFVVINEILDDQDSEYEWVLKFARDNQRRGIEFIDGYPLCNMRAGDLLEELIGDTKVNSAVEIKQWRERRAQTISYTRESQAITSPKTQAIISNIHQAADESRLQQQREEIKKLERDVSYEIMLNDPLRTERIRKQTNDLLKLELTEKSVDWHERHLKIGNKSC